MARDLTPLATFLSAEAIADLAAAHADRDPNHRVDRAELHELLARHGLHESDAVLAIEDALARLQVQNLTIGVVETVSHLAKQVTGNATLAHFAALGLTPFATTFSDSVFLVDKSGIVHHDLDSEYFGPIASSWTTWLERAAWELTHFHGGRRVRVNGYFGAEVVSALGMSEVTRISDLYDRFWRDEERGDVVLREQRVASRYAGTTLLTSSLDRAVAAMIAMQHANPDALLVTNFAEKPGQNAVRGTSAERLVLQAKGKREGVHHRDRGELMVWGREGSYRVELWIDEP